MNTVTPGKQKRIELHERVRAFIDRSARGEATDESFDGLGLAIARYQAEHGIAYRRLLTGSGCDVESADTVRALPAVPTDAFRLARIAAHPLADDAVVFRTSGTSSGARGEHALSTTETYERAALAWARWALFFDEPRPLTAIILAPPAGLGGTESSLHFMLDLFASRLARIALHLQNSPESPIQRRELEEACRKARQEGGPAIVMGTSFAFVHALDALAGERIELPAGSRALHTGGFKGRSREVEAGTLIAAIAAAFGVDESAVVGEYGMTELSSQLYEGTLRAGHGLSSPSRRHGVFVHPPWMRVVAVDPDTLQPVEPGQVGILRFEDLANVDSAVAIQTADRGRCEGPSVELLGRLSGAPPRGCSLAMDELLAER